MPPIFISKASKYVKSVETMHILHVSSRLKHLHWFSNCLINSFAGQFPDWCCLVQQAERRVSPQSMVFRPNQTFCLFLLVFRNCHRLCWVLVSLIFTWTDCCLKKIVSGHKGYIEWTRWRRWWRQRKARRNVTAVGDKESREEGRGQYPREQHVFVVHFACAGPKCSACLSPSSLTAHQWGPKEPLLSPF